ncbi:aspartate aminotransferase [Ligilactobacillus salitolerans]|uniref:Aminotransferase n=1 Tax=Ligilactobacillus salitolerans TaxID=1808352 RepID=A0A401IUB3_9LACO|nr:pyridoxal phosphate-dependent aminotransferase [Ligilactobacillus salitolerans]GBG95098.1 aspartate aminotransferase [Ligilactobacillus salitolerans]
MKLAQRVQTLEPSATIALSDQAKKLQAQGVDVVNLTAGEPDFPTPLAIKQAAIESIQSGQADSYTAAAGILPLRQALADKINQQYRTEVTAADVAITTGAKFALYLVSQVLLDPNDEVLIPVPYWVSYSEQVKLAGGVPVFVVPTSRDNKVSVADLKAHATEKTRALIINSPQNPSGSVYSKDELVQIGQWAVENGITLITDDIYRDLIYNQTEFHSLFEFAGKIREQTILISGFSKTYAMTGWRVGFIAGPGEFMQKISALLSQTTSNLTVSSQYAALAALSLPNSEIEKMRGDYEQRLNHFYPEFKALPGFSFPVKPQGAFYLFPDVTEALSLCQIETTAEFARRLLDEVHVAVVPGEAFGQPGSLRLSYAAASESLEKGVQRINKFMRVHTQEEK